MNTIARQNADFAAVSFAGGSHADEGDPIYGRFVPYQVIEARRRYDQAIARWAELRWSIRELELFDPAYTPKTEQRDCDEAWQEVVSAEEELARAWRNEQLSAKRVA